jgi:hypothetical protein
MGAAAILVRRMEKTKTRRNAMKRRLLVHAFVLFLGALIAPTVIQAGDIWHNSGKNAFAYFYAPDPTDGSGCVFVGAWVDANIGRSQSPPGRGSLDGVVNINFIQYDGCNSVYLIWAAGWEYLTGQELTVSGSSARLIKDVQVWDDVSQSLYWVTVDLAWSPTGPAVRQSDHEHVQWPGFNLNYRWSGTYRPAEATGSISDGVTNFTPETSFDGNFGTGRTMSVQVE